MADIADLGIRVDSAQALKAVSDLDELAMAGGRAEAATDGLGVASGRAAPAMGKMGGQSRMLAQQLSQVAQQSAATGNVMQAVAIQAADIGLAFGTVGAVLGTVATIALPALMAALGGTYDSAAQVRDAIDGLDDAVSAYVEAAAAANMTTAELAEKYGALAVQARAALQAMADVALVDAMNATDAAIAAVLESLTTTAEFATSDMLGMTQSALMLSDTFGMTHQQAAALRAALEGLSQADTLDAQARAAAAVQRAMEGAYGSVAAMPAPLRAAYGQMAEIVAKSSQANATMQAMPGILASARDAANSVAGAVSGIGSAAAGATGMVQGLANAMWNAAQARVAANAAVASMQPGGAQYLASQYAQYGAGRSAFNQGAKASDTLYGGPALGTGGGGGGGGGGTDPYAGNLQSLIESLRSEREIEDEWYQENLAILEDRRAQEILGKEAHDAALVALHQEYQNRIAEIDGKAAQQRIAETAGLFGALADIASAGGERTAKIVATFQAIEGTVNAYGAAIKALNTPGIGLAGRFAAYASVLAAGLKGVAAIRQAGGIGGGGGTVAAQGAVAGPAPAQDRLIVQGIRAGDIFTGQMIYDMFMGEGKLRGSPVVELMR